MDKSAFFPTVCSTVNNKKKIQRKPGLSNTFNEENSVCSIQNMNSSLEATFELEEQREMARTSLQRAHKVARIPSKYFNANFSKSTTQINSLSESTVSESDLLQTRKNTSTPRNSLLHSNSYLGDNLAELSHKIKNSSISIDNFVEDFKNVIRTADEHSNIFHPSEEAANILMADEMSWRQKYELPVQMEQFSEFNCADRVSLGEFFKEKCNTLSDLTNMESPNVTKEPVALIDTDTSFSIIEENNGKRSLSISAIQKFLALASEDTPKRTVNNLCKLASKPEENKYTTSLPVSKDCSYSSDHSENEALKLICNKENLNSLSPVSRASSALTSIHNDKLPIETTKTDLIWGCVKMGKSVTQEFIIRNKSSKRLGLQLTLTNQEFKIRKGNRNDSEPLSCIKILLHPHESKSVLVSFIPTKVGAAVDELYFTPLDPNIKQIKKQCIKLFAYGGFFKIDFSNLTRDTTGKFWLSLGKLDDRTIMTNQFYLKNKGELPAFVYITINSLETSKLQISPSFFIIQPQDEKTVLVSYKPSKEDYHFLHQTSMIVDLGALNITFGSEVDRGRMRKICERCVESGFMVDPIANILKEKIEDESIPSDIVKFKEPPGNLKEIIKFVNHHQVMLTVEKDPEQTVLQQYSDDSGLYQSLYQDTSVVCNKTLSCYVAPTILVLTIPYKCKDTIFLKSDNESKLNFVVSCQQPELEFKPKKGILEPQDTIAVTVKYVSTCNTENKKFKVSISVEHEIFEVEVNIESLSQVKNRR